VWILFSRSFCSPWRFCSVKQVVGFVIVSVKPSEAWMLWKWALQSSMHMHVDFTTLKSNHYVFTKFLSLISLEGGDEVWLPFCVVYDDAHSCEKDVCRTDIHFRFDFCHVMFSGVGEYFIETFVFCDLGRLGRAFPRSSWIK
jgi:hypothetical protein